MNSEIEYWRGIARRMQHTVSREQARNLEYARKRRETVTLVWALIATAGLLVVIAGRVM